MIYLKIFSLLDSNEESKLEIASENIYQTGVHKSNFCSSYPLNIFIKKNLKDIEFDPITIFYGNNGTGKSTLLNIICNKLNIKRYTPFNTDSFFDSYVKHCKYILGEQDGKKLNIPNSSMFISSDDIFNNIINIRNYNNEILEKRDNILNTQRPRFDEPTPEFDSDLFRESIMQNYELFIKFMNFRNMSRAKLIQKYVGTLGRVVISFYNIKQCSEPGRLPKKKTLAWHILSLRLAIASNVKMYFQ